MNKLEKEWITPTGLHAAVSMTAMGYRCGYVGVPSDHILYLAHYYDFDLFNNPHGGITFSDTLEYLGFDPELWYFGFYCGHRSDTREVCTLEFCIMECEKLAEQLKVA